MGKSKNRNRSGNPTTRASAPRPVHNVEPAPDSSERATAATWKGAAPVGAEDVRLPSGNVALVRRIGPEAFLSQGLIPDPLTPLITKAINDKKGLPPSKLKSMINDDKNLAAMMEMVDHVLCAAVVEPRVVMPPKCTECDQYYMVKGNVHTDPSADGFHPYNERERKPGVLYSDVVDLNDKVFVLNFTVGGTRDLESFRQQHGDSVARVSAGQDVDDETE